MKQHTSKVKIALADDHKLFRKGIIKLLEREGYELLFDATNGHELIEKLTGGTSVSPDIIIMDIAMPGMNGFETMAWLRANRPGIRILVVSMVDHEETIVRMLKMGVKGYLSKDTEPEDLYAALQAILKNEFYFTDLVTNKLIHAIQNEEVSQEKQSDFLLNHELWDSLSDRQKDFVRLACTPMTYAEIAAQIHVSPKTIDGYRDSVFDRFNVKNRVGLVLYAIKNKIITI